MTYPTILNDIVEKWVTPTEYASRRIVKALETDGTMQTLTYTRYASKVAPWCIATLTVVTKEKE